MDESLDTLLNSIKGGDKKAFQELYKRYYKRVYYFALQISKNNQDAQDITQETFVQLQKSLPNLKENRAFSVWLHRIIISKAGTHFRKNKEVALPEDHVAFKNYKEERSYLLPTESMHFDTDKEMMEFFLNQLDEKFRIVLTLSYYSNLRIKDIAAILEVPEGTIKSRMNKAKEILKEKIEKYQEREGVRLDFKAFDIAGGLTAFFIAEAADIVIPSTNILSFPKWMKSFSSSVGMQVAGTCAMIATGAIVTYGVYQNEQRKEIPRNMTYNQEQSINFPQVKYNEKIYDNPEDVYYELLSWAHCEIEMSEYTDYEREEIKPLYDALKSENSVYWREIERKKWNQSYENLLKK